MLSDTLTEDEIAEYKQRIKGLNAKEMLAEFKHTALQAGLIVSSESFGNFRAHLHELPIKRDRDRAGQKVDLLVEEALSRLPD